MRILFIAVNPPKPNPSNCSLNTLLTTNILCVWRFCTEVAYTFCNKLGILALRCHIACQSYVGITEN